MQLEALASVYRIASAAVYSPTEAHRIAFAKAMSAKLGIDVVPAASAEAAVRGKAVVATASGTRSKEPVVRGAWLDACRLLCAVGYTRAYAAEADLDCFRHTKLTVVDSLHALEEAGELREAVEHGLVTDASRATLAQVVAGDVTLPREGRVTFKSVGTALQDLALAARYYELLGKDAGRASEPQLATLRRPAWEKFAG
jgi:ornithine cyclodeaminase/alanine dehydrogenase-like protein (mu-crystallin family)